MQMTAIDSHSGVNTTQYELSIDRLRIRSAQIEREVALIFCFLHRSAKPNLCYKNVHEFGVYYMSEITHDLEYIRFTRHQHITTYYYLLLLISHAYIRINFLVNFSYQIMYLIILKPRYFFM